MALTNKACNVYAHISQMAILVITNRFFLFDNVSYWYAWMTIGGVVKGIIDVDNNASWIWC